MYQIYLVIDVYEYFTKFRPPTYDLWIEVYPSENTEISVGLEMWAVPGPIRLEHPDDRNFPTKVFRQFKKREAARHGPGPTSNLRI